MLQNHSGVYAKAIQLMSKFAKNQTAFGMHKLWNKHQVSFVGLLFCWQSTAQIAVWCTHCLVLRMYWATVLPWYQTLANLLHHANVLSSVHGTHVQCVKQMFSVEIQSQTHCSSYPLVWPSCATTRGSFCQRVLCEETMSTGVLYFPSLFSLSTGFEQNRAEQNSNQWRISGQTSPAAPCGNSHLQNGLFLNRCFFRKTTKYMKSRCLCSFGHTVLFIDQCLAFYSVACHKLLWSNFSFFVFKQTFTLHLPLEMISNFKNIYFQVSFSKTLWVKNNFCRSLKIFHPKLESVVLPRKTTLFCYCTASTSGILVVSGYQAVNLIHCIFSHHVLQRSSHKSCQAQWGWDQKTVLHRSMFTLNKWQKRCLNTMFQNLFKSPSSASCSLPV